MEILEEDKKHLDNIFDSVHFKHELRGLAIAALGLLGSGAYAYNHGYNHPGTSGFISPEQLAFAFKSSLVTTGIMASAYALSKRQMWRRFKTLSDEYLINESPNKREYKKTEWFRTATRLDRRPNLNELLS